jgi:carboxyl-terminal processing protease
MGKKYMLKSNAMLELRKLISFLMLAFFCVIAFASGYFVHMSLDDAEDFKLLNEAYRLLETHYIEALPQGLALQRGMVRGMLDTLDDPYTHYVEPEEHAFQTDTLAGEYGGIGALVTTDGQGQFFIAPFPEGPAADAKISEGTQLLAIDGWPLSNGVTLDDVVSHLRGPIGTLVRIRIRQPLAAQATDISLLRANIPLPSVTDYVLPGYEDVGVVAVSVFSEKTPGEVDAAIGKLVDRGVVYLILDFRNNGGGLLESAVEVSRIFLRTGIIVSEERRGAIRQTYEVQTAGTRVDIPIVVVVDSTTASAAEIVAAALQANNRALLVGDQTFGKGSVQAIVELSDGSSMRITSSRWIDPAGEEINEAGLTPDILLDTESAGTETALLRSAELLIEGNN